MSISSLIDCYLHCIVLSLNFGSPRRLFSCLLFCEVKSLLQKINASCDNVALPNLLVEVADTMVYEGRSCVSHCE